MLNSGKLEGGRRRSTDCTYSPQIYHIKKALIQKNQPVLYWIIDENRNSPKQSFVQEELLVIAKNVKLPPQRILTS